MKIGVKVIDNSSWPDIEKLFGEKGACGGCWCMYWRTEKNEKWDDIKGEKAKDRFKNGVQSGKFHGALSYIEGAPIGWISFDKRTDYIKLDRSPSLKCDDAEDVWSVPCFYVLKNFRGKGVAGKLLDFVAEYLKSNGGKILEGYPIKIDKKVPAPFAYTGTVSLFEKYGFIQADEKEKGKRRYRKYLIDG